jgi:pimeloyl-ACP methyl ester carboxylesterase
MPTCTVNKISLYYEQHGSGPELVLIAGLTGDHTTWQNVLPELAQHFHVTVFDNRGVGQTDAPKEKYSTAQMADDVFELIGALTVEQPFVVGHSMGGLIAQQLAARHPECVKKLMLFSTRSSGYSALTKFHLECLAELSGLGIKRETLLKNAATFLFAENFLQDQNRLQAFIKATCAMKQSAQGYAGQFAASSTHNADAILQNITAPTMVVAGSDDILIPPRLSQALHELIPHSDYQEIRVCGHMPTWEQPEVFVEWLKSFLL